MNRVHTLLAVLCLAAAIVGWRVIEDRPSTATVATKAPMAAATDPATNPSPPARHANSTSAESGPHGTATPMPGEDTPLAENPNCQVSRQYFDPETGDLRDVYSCPSAEEREQHAYDNWSDETLASLAYGDAKAAEVLGLRHVVSEDPNQEALGLTLLYRSVALSGDLETFRKAIGRRYAYVSYNGQPLVHNLKQLMVFNLIGNVLGDQRFDPLPIENRLKELEVPSDELDRIHNAASQILTSMAQLQTEVTGDTTISEVLNNA